MRVIGKTTRKMQLGNFQLSFIDCGRFRLDGGAMFSVVPKVLWEKTNPPDELNRIDLAANALLIEDGTRRILVETGTGNKHSAKFREMFAIEDRSVIDGLADVGLKPEQIDEVISTHLHFDHAGGNTIQKDGKPVPTFSNATYHVQKTEWEWAKSPSLRDGASYVNDDFLPLENSSALNLIEGQVEPFPGIKLVPTPGHNQGHQSVVISSGGETALFATDLCPTSSHLHLPFIMSYDLFPLLVMENKKKMLDLAVDQGWKMLFYHDPKVLYGNLVRNARGRFELLDTVEI
jgi:glyoxylase-like metal-dependent hydrolase (beta-lactamase superfamily II)